MNENTGANGEPVYRPKTYTQEEAISAIRDAVGVCPQCGFNYWRGACGPTHAVRAQEIDSILRDLADRIERYETLEDACMWAIEHGYSTGHADTIRDLLDELEPQILRRGQRETCSVSESAY